MDGPPEGKKLKKGGGGGGWIEREGEREREIENKNGKRREGKRCGASWRNVRRYAKFGTWFISEASHANLERARSLAIDVIYTCHCGFRTSVLVQIINRCSPIARTTSSPRLEEIPLHFPRRPPHRFFRFKNFAKVRRGERRGMDRSGKLRPIVQCINFLSLRSTIRPRCDGFTISRNCISERRQLDRNLSRRLRRFRKHRRLLVSLVFSISSSLPSVSHSATATRISNE